MTTIFRNLPGRRVRAAAALALLATASAVFGAVHARAAAVSPMAVYLNDRARTGTLTLFNPGQLPEEIEIGFAFGYPTSDADGNVLLDLVEEAAPGEPSAVPWLRAFPRRLVLGPGERQIVRVMIQPPAGLEDGEYWARALIHARGGQAPIEQRRGDVGVQVSVETVVVAAVNYRHGAVRTGLEVRGAGARKDGAHGVATIDLARTGNAAFLGRLLVEVVDARGRVVASGEDVLAVYREMRRRMELEVPADVVGPLQVRYTMDTQREDLPEGGPLPFEPLQHVVPVP